MKTKVLFFVLVAVFLSGCFRLTTKALGKLVDERKQAIAQGYVQKLKDGRLDELAAELKPQMQMEESALIEKLKEVRRYLPQETPTQIDLVGYHTNTINGKTSIQVVYQYGYGDRWAVATVTWLGLPDNGTQLQGLYINLLNQPLQEIYGLTLSGKSLRHYLFGAFAFIIPIFIITTLIVCIRTRFNGRKWPWILFILVGVGRISLNWTTGEIGLQPVFVSLIGVSAVTSNIIGPWIVSLSLPLGAICFWLRRKTQPPPATTHFAYQTPE